MHGIPAAKAENTSEYRKMPAAGQPGEERRGVACLCKGSYSMNRSPPAWCQQEAELLHSLPACVQLAKPDSLQALPGRASMIQSFLVQQNKVPPPHAPNFPALPLQNLPMNTRTYCSAQSLRMVRRPTLCCTRDSVGRRPS